MNRHFLLPIAIIVSMVLLDPVYAESNDASHPQESQNQIQTLAPGSQIVSPKQGISWKEKVMMQRYLQKRAAASRNALKRKAATETPQNAPNLSLKQSQPMSP